MSRVERVVKGHEIWVLPEDGLLYRGQEGRFRVFFGHAMHPDGLAQQERLTAWAVDPGGERLRLGVEAGGDSHLVRVVPEREGLWALTVENDVGPYVLTRGGLYKPGTRKEYPDAREAAYYYQYAKTCFRVGHLCVACGDLFKQADVSFLGHELELVLAPGDYRAGDEVALQVRYRGGPLPRAVVAVTWSGWEKKDWANRLVTDERGRGKAALSAPGHWLFYVRHVDHGRGVAGEFERRVTSATVSLWGVN
ncbi:MAG: DUF4198 domain-containing protein [Thermoanaerobacteraceae bacterium]|jgi:uncharacterized GH25 family protein|nr:DUF4198 domain-containing protein [Thermoanaerobacteraceae bacterium]